jgi:hypothetical protein
MRDKPKIAFKPKSVFVKFANILPVRKYPKDIRKSRKYQQIKASIQEIGIIEPPSVYRVAGKKGQFLLLDGHLLVEVLKELGAEGVTCLISTDDEAFTYNKRINRLATIQEHKMILKVIENGVTEEHIAKTLDVNVSSIRTKRRLLDGLCPEAVDLLKDKHCSVSTFEVLKKMKPMRQVEVAQLMTDMNNYSRDYSKAVLIATPQDQLVEADKPKKFKGLSAEQIERMEREMANLQSQMKLHEDSYGPDHLNLVLARGYLANLFKNEKVFKYLTQNHGEILGEFQKIAEVVSIAEGKI